LQNQQCQTNMEPAAQIQENNRNHIEKFWNILHLSGK
jgi:hypothetical protein